MSPLEQVYDPEAFRQQAHRLADQLADSLAAALNRSGPVLPWMEPSDELVWWTARMQEPPESPADFLADVMAHSIRLHHPRYVGHQVCAPAPAAALASLVGSLLNNGMAIYEMGPAATALERWLVRLTCNHLGFSQGDGILTSGGTLAMLTALLAAREKAAPQPAQRLCVLASEEAHYCVRRAVRIMGWGAEGLVPVPTDDRFRMETAKLEFLYDEACRRGLRPIAVVGCACSTSTGSYDDLNAIANFCRTKGLWFHADGAHGAAVAFSSALRSKITGIEQADSAIMDYHKMLLTPALATAVLFRDGRDSWAAFHDRAQYLWDEKSPDEWFNTGRRTFECTKLMMGLKFATLWKAHGPECLVENLERTHQLAANFAQEIEQRNGFELAVQPESNIVCFRIAPRDLSPEETDSLNARIRQHIIRSGQFYLVQTSLRSRTWLRTALMNPFTTLEDLQILLDLITSLAP